jgi:hypothetical protein
MNIEHRGIAEIYMQLYTVLKLAVDRDCRPQACSLLEQMLDRGSAAVEASGPSPMVANI